MLPRRLHAGPSARHGKAVRAVEALRSQRSTRAINPCAHRHGSWACRASGAGQSSLTACRHQALAAVSPPSGASQNAWVYICPGAGQNPTASYHTDSRVLAYHDCYAAALQDLVLDMSGNRSVHGGRTRFLKEGDTFGVIPFFTGSEQMEASRERSTNPSVSVPAAGVSSAGIIPSYSVPEQMEASRGCQFVCVASEAGVPAVGILSFSFLLLVAAGQSFILRLQQGMANQADNLAANCVFQDGRPCRKLCRKHACPCCRQLRA
jgi:hypothetical protein